MTGIISNPLLAAYYLPNQSEVHYVMCPPRWYTHHEYGLMICDVVRHVAKAFGVTEDEVWKYVDEERRHPTTNITTVMRKGW